MCLLLFCRCRHGSHMSCIGLYLLLNFCLRSWSVIAAFKRNRNSSNVFVTIYKIYLVLFGFNLTLLMSKLPFACASVS